MKKIFRWTKCVKRSSSVRGGTSHENQVIRNKRYEAGYSYELDVWKCQAVRHSSAVSGMQLHLCMAGNVWSKYCRHSPPWPPLDTPILIPDWVINNVLLCLEGRVLIWGWAWRRLGWIGVRKIRRSGLTRNRRVWCNDAGSSPSPWRDLWGTAKTHRVVMALMEYFLICDTETNCILIASSGWKTSHCTGLSYERQLPLSSRNCHEPCNYFLAYQAK